MARIAYLGPRGTFCEAALLTMPASADAEHVPAISVQAAIDALTDSIKENGKSLDVTTEKGRANQDSLDAMANSAIRRRWSGSSARNAFHCSASSSSRAGNDSAAAMPYSAVIR